MNTLFEIRLGGIHSLIEISDRRSRSYGREHVCTYKNRTFRDVWHNHDIIQLYKQWPARNRRDRHAISVRSGTENNPAFRDISFSSSSHNRPKRTGRDRSSGNNTRGLCWISQIHLFDKIDQIRIARHAMNVEIVIFSLRQASASSMFLLTIFGSESEGIFVQPS